MRRLGEVLSARKCYFVNVHITVCVEFFQAFRWQYQPEGALGWHAESLYRTQLSSALSYAVALIVCAPAASVDVLNVVPPFFMTVPSTSQSTLMTAGSTTFTLSTPGLVTAPAAGSVESIGFTFFQMLITICSRETELNAVLGVHFVSSFVLQNIEFIIEFAVGR